MEQDMCAAADAADPPDGPPCAGCGGDGYSPAARALRDTYDLKGPLGNWADLLPPGFAAALCWHDKLGPEDAAAVAGVPTGSPFSSYSVRDALVESRCARLGVDSRCAACHGWGIRET